jgi:hypothetical protein
VELKALNWLQIVKHRSMRLLPGRKKARNSKKCVPSFWKKPVEICASTAEERPKYAFAVPVRCDK